jgi:multidrug efflux pump subunit AcrA (membrane-fusion protein)
VGFARTYPEERAADSVLLRWPGMGEWDAGEATQIRAFPFVGADRILVADSDLYRRNWLRHTVGGTFGIEEVDNARAALERLTGDPPKILVVGSDLVDISGGVLLTHAARHGLVGAHKGGPVVFLLADTPETAADVDEQLIPVFYRLTPALQPERARELFQQALARSTPHQPRIVDETEGARGRQIVEHAKRLGAATDVATAASAAITAILDVMRADRARCLYYDDESGTLWSETGDGADETQASAGVAGFAVRAGTAVVLARAASDPAYRPHVDDPAGTGEERIAIQPVVDRDGQIHAVLIAIREPGQPEFTQGDARLIGELAGAWAPFIHQLALESEAQSRTSGADQDEMFRQEAIQHMVRRGVKGDVVRVHPGWLSAAYWIVVAAVLASAGFALFARVHQWAEGPSVIRVTGRSDLIAFDGGSVTAVEVKPGEEVTAGQVLVRLHDTEQAGRMKGLEYDFERRLIAYLQTPQDPNVRQALASLVSERESAKANLEARVIRAPHDGVVKDVLVSNGQRVDAGKVVVSIAKKGAPEGLSVIAFVPGGDRPRLHVGQPMRVTLPGYRGAVVESTVRGISADAIGATDAKARYLGDRLGDSISIRGSVVVVEALLPATFTSDDETYELHDGMIGQAEVQLESKTVLETVIPGLQ